MNSNRDNFGYEYGYGSDIRRISDTNWISEE
jgi:hypothetical protein